MPKKKGRQKKINQIKEIDSSIILYEAPYRINRTLSDLYSYLGDRKIFIAREMTKIYEQHFYGTIKSMIEQIEQLKEFKTKAITIFMIAQALTGFILAYTHVI